MIGVGFDLTGMEEVDFGLTGMASNCGTRIFSCLEWLGMEEVSIGLTGIDWNGVSRFWPDWNELECRKSVLA
jgi:hypothetical protein